MPSRRALRDISARPIEPAYRRHPDVDPDAALDEATRIYRRPTTIRRYLQQQQGALTLTPEYDQRSRHAESKMRPLTPGPSAAVKVTPVSPSITSFASHDPQPNFAVSRLSTMKGRSELEDDHELQLLDAANSRVPSSQATEEHGATAMDLDISVQSEHILSTMTAMIFDASTILLGFSTKCGFPRQYALGSLGGRLFR
ncbi:hypothetical protein DFH94DRAFT_768349 [Russula ochroleuca]|uniref:Uncharacterized protein n=1 Tax=Russula ochroleuca TaxID=152965 RepID=A0A9P5MQ44_9AGAM|nr:hypothetical protein DFH94DRAFT_768349 [Russula ochroleuca]